MKKLSEQFTKHGFLHRQIVREGNFAVYQRQKGQTIHFETIIIGSHNGYTLGGAIIPPAETYPNAEQWGSKGWTSTDREGALRRLELLKESK